ncbi:MAG: hypothetical protein ACE5G0_03060 [Rhodothermales bacterium]
MKYFVALLLLPLVWTGALQGLTVEPVEITEWPVPRIDSLKILL